MFAQVIWWVGDFLVLVLLVRGIQTGLPRTFPIFYLYLAWTLIEGVTLTAVRLQWPDYYLTVGWAARLPLITLEYGILWEISRNVFQRFPGAGKVASRLILLIFALLASRYLLASGLSADDFLQRSLFLIERDLHMTEAVILFVIIVSLKYYMIGLQRNIFGLILGYGLFISVDVVTLTARAYFWGEYGIWWGHTKGLAYILCLVVWLVFLWTGEPSPMDSRSPVTERAYGIVSRETSSAIRRGLDSLRRMVLPWRG